jgi:L-lactate dehydrogenase (cytochrome)
MLGQKTEAPFFIAPMAMQRLFHQEGEREMSRGAAAGGLIQGVSTSSSFLLDEIIATAIEGQGHWLQLYVNKDRSKTISLLQEAVKLGYKAILVTVDAPVMGKREADERVLLDGTISSGTSGQKGQNDKKGGGIGRIMGQYVDASLRWEDLRWIKVAAGGLPVVVKGVQNAADVMEAVKRGVEGIYLSNHGGRSLDT